MSQPCGLDAGLERGFLHRGASMAAPIHYAYMFDGRRVTPLCRPDGGPEVSANELYCVTEKWVRCPACLEALFVRRFGARRRDKRRY
jgi:hypothetical protein